MRTRTAAVASAAAAVVLLGIAALVDSRMPTRAAAVVELLAGVVAGFGAVQCARAARRRGGRHAGGWWCMAAAMLLWMVSSVANDVPVLLGADPMTSAAGVLRVLAIVLAIASLVLLPSGRWAPGAALRTWIDVAATAMCAVLLGAVVLAPWVLENVDDPGTRGLSLGYPLVGLLLTCLAYVASRRFVDRPRLDLSLLVPAFGCWMVAGLVAAVTATDDTVGHPLASYWFTLGIVLVALAARTSRGATVEPRDLPTWAAKALVALPDLVLISTAVLVVVLSIETWYAWTIAAVCVPLVFARQSLVAIDARRSRAMLEAQVAERTAELHLVSTRSARILAAIDEGIVGVDPEDEVTFANVAAGRLLGRSPEEIVGQAACEVLCGGVHENCPLQLVGTTGHVLVDEQSSFLRSDGTVVPVEMTVAPTEQPGPDGRSGVVVAFRDVTERRAVEQMKRQFVSSVSHELRTPLTSIRGMLEMLVDGDAGELSEMAHRMLATAQRGSERLGRLVNDIIDVEKLAAGDFSVAPRPTDVAAVVGDAISSLEGLSATSGVRITTGELTGGDAMCDPDRIEQALVNLIGNAVKFSPVDGEVVVEAVPYDAEVLVSVRDQGRGIPEDQVEKVFERFHQVATTDATVKGGTGLGLTITRSIVERHGGRIWVESQVGHGTTFHFTLPAAPSAPVVAVEASRPVPATR